MRRPWRRAPNHRRSRSRRWPLAPAPRTPSPSSITDRRSSPRRTPRARPGHRHRHPCGWRDRRAGSGSPRPPDRPPGRGLLRERRRGGWLDGLWRGERRRRGCLRRGRYRVWRWAWSSAAAGDGIEQGGCNVGAVSGGASETCACAGGLRPKPRPGPHIKAPLPGVPRACPFPSRTVSKLARDGGIRPPRSWGENGRGSGRAAGQPALPGADAGSISRNLPTRSFNEALQKRPASIAVCVFIILKASFLLAAACFNRWSLLSEGSRLR